MKILLIGNYAKDHQYSMLKFSDCLEQELLQQGHQVKLCQPQAVFGRRFESTVTGIAKWVGYIDKYLLFPFSLITQIKWADIIHVCDHSNAMYIPYIKSHAHIVTCHDLMAVRSALGDFAENNAVGFFGKLQQRWIIRGLCSAKYLATVSNATKQDVLRLTEKPSTSVTVIHNGLNYPFKPIEKQQAFAVLDEYGINENTRFLLHVGGNQWYKNRTGLLAIFNQINRQQPDTDLKFVMAGKPFGTELNALVRQNKLQNKIIELSDVSTEALCALYSLADAFIFPSLLEGFGWPIIEAQACDALVFTSNREPMTEVGGKAAIYIDPDIPDQAASIILESLGDPELIEKIKSEIATNLQQFTTEKMVSDYVSLYQSIISQGTKE